MRLTNYQKELLDELQSILAEGSKNTHQIAVARGDRQAYETSLRDRLFVLAEKGLLSFEKTTRGRFWALVGEQS